MLSASLNTTSMSCSTRSTLRSPSASMSLRICTARAVSSIDRPWVDSSSIRSRGFCAIAMATSSRRWSPCESMAAVTSAKRASRRRSIAASATAEEALSTLPPPRNRQRRRSRACAAMRTFSRTLRAGNTWQSWKVRAMPFCATWCTGSTVMSSPAEMTPLALGSSALVSMIQVVDVPAPFGPMTARISPRSTVRSTSSTATSAPNRRTSRLHSSSGTGRLLAAVRVGRLRLGAGPAREHAPDALRRENDEGHEDRAEDERPQIGHLGELMLEEDEGHAAEDRADQRARSAHDHHDEDAARGEPEEQFGRGEAGKGGVERAREPAEAVSEHDGRDLVRARVVAERDRLGLVLADAGKHGAERRAHDGAAQEIGAEQAEQHEVVVAELALEPIDPKGAGKTRDADQAVGAAGDVAKPEQHGVAELREGEREHREGHAGRARA